jgi:hypothetical protein
MANSGRAKSDVATRPVDKTYADVIHCEDVIGYHEVHPSVWPPRANGINQAMPDLSLPCVKCGCQNTVYEWHATAEESRIKVVMPGKKVTA